MLLNEDVQTLTGFGLTVLQAKVYLTLVKSGKCTVKKTAELTNIARQEAQRVIIELSSLGFVEKILAKPAEFQPIPINDVISFLLERREKKSLDLKEKTNVLLKKFDHSQPKSAENAENQFVMTTGKESIIKKSRSVVDRTRESCDLINGVWKNVGYASALFKDQNIQALKRHVKIRIVAQRIAVQQSVRKIYQHSFGDPNFEIRFVPFSLPAILGVYDRKELLVYTSPDKLVGDSPMLWTNSLALIASVEAYFEKLWKEAECVAGKGSLTRANDAAEIALQ